MSILWLNKYFKNIKHSLLNFIKNSKYEYIDFYNFGIDKYFDKLDLRKINLTNKFIIPNYYEPFENKNIKFVLYFGTKIKLLIFKGDGDQGRPNQIKKISGILY